MCHLFWVHYSTSYLWLVNITLEYNKIWDLEMLMIDLLNEKRMIFRWRLSVSPYIKTLWELGNGNFFVLHFIMRSIRISTVQFGSIIPFGWTNQWVILLINYWSIVDRRSPHRIVSSSTLLTTSAHSFNGSTSKVIVQISLRPTGSCWLSCYLFSHAR